MFNVVVIAGRLTSTPELKHTQNGVSVASFTLAVDRPYRKDQEKQTDFVNCVAWRGSAEFICKHFEKGNMIGVEGSIQARKYTDKDGKSRTAYEVVASNVHFMEGKKQDKPKADVAPPMQQGFANNEQGFEEIIADEGLPF